MKNRKISLIVCLLTSSILFSSCIGSFTLWHKVLSWNQSVGNKFVNELVFICFHIIPVYEVAGIMDIVVLNTIEFWSGNNPATANVGKVQKIEGSDGQQYMVKTEKNGYEITKQNGQKVDFKYNKADQSWNIESNGKKAQLFKMNADGTAQVTLNNGKKMNVALNAQGMYAANAAINGNTYYAAR